MNKNDIINRIKNKEPLQFVNETFENINLSQLDLHNAKFIKCKFLNVKFKYTNLQCVDFINSTLEYVCFTFSDLSIIKHKK